jgi:hypothetical protein
VLSKGIITEMISHIKEKEYAINIRILMEIIILIDIVAIVHKRANLLLLNL